ncbi:MAG: hypothetical protein K6E12_01015 [Saccharofermentans sp.]|nr:hypothetical protein [Saccharofermentans sp.]
MSWIIPLLTGLAILVAGILITVNKTKSTRMLGISFIFNAIKVLIAGIYTIAVHNLKGEEVAAIVYPYNTAVIITGCLSTLFLCFFIHKNYGKKLIYLPLFIIPAAGWLADRIIIMTLSKFIGAGNSIGLWIELTSQIDNSIISAAVAVIVFIVFFKNRKTEKVIPKAWLIKAILLGWSLLHTIIYTCILLHMISNESSVSGMDYRILTLISNPIAFAFPLYVLISVFAASKTKEEDEPYDLPEPPYQI